MIRSREGALLPYGTEGFKEIRENFAKFPIPVFDTILRDATSKKLQEASTEQVDLGLGAAVR